MNHEPFVASVDRYLQSLLDDQRQTWSTTQRDLAEVIDVVSSLALASGKRVRPQCVDLGWRAAGGAVGEMTPVRIGAAIELLHVSALLHDDIIDDAATRRGAATAHRIAEDAHRQHLWAGEARRYGEGVALLAGDVALALADVALGDVSPDTNEQWRAVRLDVSMGQFLDHVATARRVRAADVSDVIVQLKTAQYTVARPLLLGAYAADPARAQQLEPVLTAFGRSIGRAFQLHDDILGVFGDTEVTGKPVGDDLREGKPTVLLARAMDRADDAQHKILSSVGDQGLTDQEIIDIAAVIEATGARTIVEEEITHLTTSAIDEISRSSIAADVADDLIRLAQSLVKRDA